MTIALFGRILEGFGIWMLLAVLIGGAFSRMKKAQPRTPKQMHIVRRSA